MISFNSPQDPWGVTAGLTNLGSTLAQGINQSQIRKREQGQSSAYFDTLSEVLSESGNKALGFEDLIETSIRAGKKGVPQDLIQSQATLLGNLLKQNQVGLGIDDREELVDLFSRIGMEEDDANTQADLYSILTPGGKTAFANNLFENIQRGRLGKKRGAETISTDNEFVEEKVEEFQWPELDTFQDLTDKDKVARQKELFNVNAKDYNDIKSTIRSKEKIGRELQQLTKINNSDKLPTNLKKWNVNFKTGELRYPGAANDETQLFVKTINDFTTQAKDSFGARVTNFELDRFMKRLPTLANTPEGRRLILEQMSILNDIDTLYQKAEKEVYDKYGLRNIDPQQMTNIAEDLMSEELNTLNERMDQVLEINNIYDAKQFAPQGTQVMKNPNGELKYVKIEDTEKAVTKGYQPL